VTEAPDAGRATEILAGDEKIDLIVTDMVMPDKTGADLATEAAITHPTTPVIIMSGYSEEMANREWRLPRNATFIEKPVSPVDLVKLVYSLLEGTPVH
jgi:two-component system cell cycle sensor histidine kinase/response regulator CckA